MAEQTRAATPAEATVTLVESEDVLHQDVRTVRLRLRKPEPKKKVQWQSGTVDNEHLNKKKSKCCCQYEKPHAFDESSSSSEEECENCHGHVERKKKKSKEPPGSTEASAELRTWLKAFHHNILTFSGAVHVNISNHNEASAPN